MIQPIFEQMKNSNTETIPSLQSTDQASIGLESTVIFRKPVHAERLFFEGKLKIGGPIYKPDGS